MVEQVGCADRECQIVALLAVTATTASEAAAPHTFAPAPAFTAARTAAATTTTATRTA